MSVKRLRIGTCSWNFDSWVGLVYTTRRRKAAEYLAEYAQHFDTAEVDSWFYGIPSRTSVQEYRSAVPADFRFTCKVPQEITLTHHRRRTRSEPLRRNPSFLSVQRFEQFIAAIEPVLPQMDAVMLEFEYLNKQKMSGAAEFLECLDGFFAGAPRGIPYAVEPRNPQYLTAEYFAFLVENKVTHVFSEKLYMPHVWDVYARHERTLRELPNAVVRLLGGDRGEMERKTGRVWNEVVEAKPGNREKVAGLTSALTSHAYTILNVNNHYEGSAPLTIEQLRNELGSH